MPVSQADPRHPPLYLTSPLLARAGLPHLFSTRHFPGVRPWRDPRGPFDTSALAGVDTGGVPAEGFAFARQVHGADVVVATRAGLVGQADVLMTEQPGLPLAIFTADCVPIVVYDEPNRRLAMAHAGWRGTVERAAHVAVDALVKVGGRAETFLAAIGPSIGPCCYEVDGPVIDRLETAFPGGWSGWVTATRPGKWMLDLWKANQDQLLEAGLGESRIDNLRLCTACREDLFYSYRRGRGEGRLVALAALPDGCRAHRRADVDPVPNRRVRIGHRAWVSKRSAPTWNECTRPSSGACARAGRSPADVLLIAVSKTVEVERIRLADRRREWRRSARIACRRPGRRSRRSVARCRGISSAPSRRTRPRTRRGCSTGSTRSTASSWRGSWTGARGPSDGRSTCSSR